MCWKNDIPQERAQQSNPTRRKQKLSEKLGVISYISDGLMAINQPDREIVFFFFTRSNEQSFIVY